VIAANRPILILDEPQKMEGARTVESMKEFNPLFILRYSATISRNTTRFTGWMPGCVQSKACQKDRRRGLA